MNKDRYQRGVKKFKEMKGEEAGAQAIENLHELDADLARYVIEFPFGDIYSRPGVDLKTRELATVSALIAMGNAPTQLKVHIQSALHLGISRKEITEIIIQLSVYAGFPAALNAMRVAKDVFKEIDDNKKELGKVKTFNPKKVVPHLIK